MEPKLSKKIKAFGFIMTCFMVCYHCWERDNAYAVAQWDAILNPLVNRFFATMGFVAMSYFFTVTGFLLFRDLRMENYGAKIRRRVSTLLIPYVIWQVLTVIKNNLQLWMQGQNGTNLSSFLLRTFTLVEFPENGALWYVYGIFLLAILSPVILVLMKNKWCGLITLLAAVLFVNLKGRIPIVNGFLGLGVLPNICMYLPSYLSGAFLGRFSRDLKQKDCLLCVPVIFLATVFTEQIAPGNLVMTCIFLLPILLLILVPGVGFLEDMWVYRLSFLVYALHSPVIADLKQLLVDAVPGMAASVYNLLVRLLVLTVVLMLAAVVHITCKRYAPKLLVLLTGGRG